MLNRLWSLVLLKNYSGILDGYNQSQGLNLWVGRRFHTYWKARDRGRSQDSTYRSLKTVCAQLGCSLWVLNVNIHQLTWILHRLYTSVNCFDILHLILTTRRHMTSPKEIFLKHDHDPKEENYSLFLTGLLCRKKGLKIHFWASHATERYLSGISLGNKLTRFEGKRTLFLRRCQWRQITSTTINALKFLCVYVPAVQAWILSI